MKYIIWSNCVAFFIKKLDEGRITALFGVINLNLKKKKSLYVWSSTKAHLNFVFKNVLFFEIAYCQWQFHSRVLDPKLLWTEKPIDQFGCNAWEKKRHKWTSHAEGLGNKIEHKRQTTLLTWKFSWAQVLKMTSVQILFIKRKNAQEFHFEANIGGYIQYSKTHITWHNHRMT